MVEFGWYGDGDGVARRKKGERGKGRRNGEGRVKAN